MIDTVSTTGLEAHSKNAIYSATKWATTGLSKKSVTEMLQLGVFGMDGAMRKCICILVE